MGKRGILLAVSSLPGKYGVGDFSSEAFEFIKLLKKIILILKKNIILNMKRLELFRKE